MDMKPTWRQRLRIMCRLFGHDPTPYTTKGPLPQKLIVACRRCGRVFGGQGWLDEIARKAAAKKKEGLK